MQKKRAGCSQTIGFVVLAVAAVFIWTQLVDKKTPNTQDSSAITASPRAVVQTTENRLAEIDAGHSVSDSDSGVKKFRNLLDQLEAKTKTPKEDIANMTIRGQRILYDEYKKNMSLLELMNGVNNSLPDPMPTNMEYKEALALFITTYATLNP